MRRQYMQEYYKKNPKKQVEANRNTRARRKQALDEIKAAKGCVRCGIKDPAVLDFHHRNPEEKDFAIADSGFREKRVAVLFLELEKCDVLCANCHRLHHKALRPAANDPAEPLNASGIF